MKAGKKTIFIMLLFIPFFFSCKDKKNIRLEKDMESMQKQMRILSNRLTSIEERLYKAAKNRQQDTTPVKNPAEEQGTAKIKIPKANKGRFPSEFEFPEYKIKITDFNCYKGVGNIAAYGGNVITKRDIQMLNLNISFFDLRGKLIGGHSFPVKVIFADTPKSFHNADTIEGGFKKIDSMTLEVDFISYSDFSIEGRALEKPQY